MAIGELLVIATLGALIMVPAILIPVLIVRKRRQRKERKDSDNAS
jgi:hypothetical protein